MTDRYAAARRLLLLGVGRRLSVAAILVAALWAGFFWATGGLGGA